MSDIRIIIFLLSLTFSVKILSQRQESGDFAHLIHLSDSLLYDQPLKSLSFGEQAYQLAVSDSLKAIALNRIGSAQWSVGNHLEALEQIQASLQISDVGEYHKIEARNLHMIGKIYAASGLDLDAIGYFRSVLSLLSTDEARGREKLFVINNDLGRAFLNRSDYDSALRYFDKASTFLDKEFQNVHPIYFLNQSEFYFRLGDLSRADSLVQEALTTAYAFNSLRWIILSNELISRLSIEQGLLVASNDYATKAYEMAQVSGLKELIFKTSKTLSKSKGLLGEFQEAYAYQMIYETYLDSVQNVKTVNELELLSYYQRLFRMRVLESKNELNKQLALQRQWIIYGLALILIIAALMIYVIIRRGKKIRKQKKQLEELDQFKSKIFAIVSHDLQSPIQSVASVIEMFNAKLLSREEIAPTIPQVREKTTNLMNLLNNVFKWAEGQMEGQQMEKSVFSLHELVQELKSELEPRLSEKEISLQAEKLINSELYSNAGVVRILLRNLIVNAIKFSNANSTIDLNYKQKENVSEVEVIDHGLGMSPEVKEGLFKGALVSTPGTKGEQGNGLGLALCYDFAKSLGGMMEVESELGKGSVFRLILPNADVPQLS